MPLYVKDGSRTETLSSFRIPLSIFWNYFQNQNKRTSVGLRKSESNQAAVNKYGSGNVSLPTVDQTAYPEQILLHLSRSKILETLHYFLDLTTLRVEEIKKEL